MKDIEERLNRILDTVTQIEKHMIDQEVTLQLLGKEIKQLHILASRLPEIMVSEC